MLQDTVPHRAVLRCAQVVNLEPDTGRVLRRWGAGRFYMPHMITVDRHGDVWIVDVGLHQVGEAGRWDRGSEWALPASLWRCLVSL